MITNSPNTINVRLSTNNNIVVVMENFGLPDNSPSIILQNTPVLVGNAVVSVENLTNVDSSNEMTGDILVYNANTKQWVAQLMPIMNGGTF